MVSSDSVEKIPKGIDSTPNGLLLKKGKGKFKNDKNL